MTDRDTTGPPTTQQIGHVLRMVADYPFLTAGQLKTAAKMQWSDDKGSIGHALQILRRRGYIEKIRIDPRPHIAGGWVITEKASLRAAEIAEQQQAVRDRRTPTPLDAASNRSQP